MADPCGALGGLESFLFLGKCNGPVSWRLKFSRQRPASRDGDWLGRSPGPGSGERGGLGPPLPSRTVLPIVGEPFGWKHQNHTHNHIHTGPRTHTHTPYFVLLLEESSCLCPCESQKPQAPVKLIAAYLASSCDPAWHLGIGALSDSSDFPKKPMEGGRPPLLLGVMRLWGPERKLRSRGPGSLWLEPPLLFLPLGPPSGEGHLPCLQGQAQRWPFLPDCLPAARRAACPGPWFPSWARLSVCLLPLSLQTTSPLLPWGSGPRPALWTPRPFGPSRRHTQGLGGGTRDADMGALHQQGAEPRSGSQQSPAHLQF